MYFYFQVVNIFYFGSIFLLFIPIVEALINQFVLVFFWDMHINDFYTSDGKYKDHIFAFEVSKPF